MKKLLIFIGIVSLLGCREELVVEPITYSKLLTGDVSKSWKLEVIQFRENYVKQWEFDVPNNCIYDDLYVFYANSVKTVEINEGNSTCNEGDPLIFLTDTWALVNANATIEITEIEMAIV